VKLTLDFEKLGKLVVLLATLVAFYYPIGVFFISQLSLPNTIVNVGIRLVFALGFAILILIRIPKLKLDFKLPHYLWFILGFWVFYASRVSFDLYRGISFAVYSNWTVVGIGFGNILAPLIAVILYKKYIKAENIATFIFWILFVANVLVLTCFLIQNNGFTPELLIRRPHIYQYNNYNISTTQAILNPIQIGYYGGLLALSSLYFFWFVKKRSTIVVLFGIVLGLAMLILGASRGPFVSFLFSLLIMLYYKLKVSKSLIIQVSKILIFVFVSVFVVKNTVAKKFSIDDFSMFSRMSSFVEERKRNKEEARDVVFRNAWNDFLDRPLAGKYFVTSVERHYPHNIIIEVFMATGVIGAFLYFGFFIPLLYNLARVITNAMGPKMFFMGILLMPILVGNMFSGSLFQSVDLWIVMTLFLVGCSNKIKSPAIVEG